ncbi:unnamed protein product, partial [Polarella glacialis]
MACAADSLSSRRRSSRSLCALAAVAATIASIAPAFTGVGCSWRRSSQHLVARGSASAPFPIWEDDIDISRTVRELLAEAKPPEEAMRQAAVTWPGLWRVVQAPHLRSIGSVALTRVDVYYDIATQGDGFAIRSFVRFEGPLWHGWLNAAGDVHALPVKTPEVEINFSDFWVDLDSALPRKASEQRDEMLRSIAAPFFVRDLSHFPVSAVDGRSNLTIF